MDKNNCVITLTFGDSAENHVGMEKLGTMVPEGQGYSVEELMDIQTILALEKDIESEYIPLGEEAAVLVLKEGVSKLLEGVGTKEDLFEEQASLDMDKKALMYGRVVNKHARWNLCFDEKGQEAEYEKGKGTIVAYEDVPLTKHLQESLSSYFGPKASNLKCEGNYYYDLKKCGIGFHGDSERRKVIGVRLGGFIPMHWQWFLEGNPIGEPILVPLDGGDIYIMSEKAVGTDWKKKKIPTLRHATGCAKFTTV